MFERKTRSSGSSTAEKKGGNRGGNRREGYSMIKRNENRQQITSKFETVPPCASPPCSSSLLPNTFLGVPIPFVPSALNTTLAPAEPNSEASSTGPCSTFASHPPHLSRDGVVDPHLVNEGNGFDAERLSERVHNSETSSSLCIRPWTYRGR